MKIGSFSTIKNPKYYELCKGNQNTHLKSSDFEIKMDWDIFQIHTILIILILLFFWICQSFFTKLWKKIARNSYLDFVYGARVTFVLCINIFLS